MGIETSRRIAAIVPAYNEAERIGGVLGPLVSCGRFFEILVVDDGSKDATAEMAARFPVRVIRLEKNVGKAQAMELGVGATDAPYIFFCDADMIGLTPEMIGEILQPVLDGETEMMLAMHDRTIYFLSFILSVIPLLAGQRALTRELWERIPAECKRGFMIEGALNFYARYWGKGYQFKVFEGLSQVIKEEKYGFFSGFQARVKMHVQIFLLYTRLQLLEVPPTIKSFRIAAANIAWASVGAIFGLLILVASYTGPATFIREVFADDIQTESSTPLIDLMLYVAVNAGVDLIATVGVLIVAFNALVILLNVANVRYFKQFSPAPAERIH